MAQDQEGKLKTKLGGEFEGSVAAKISEFGGLLTREAAIRLLCKQNGIETEERLSLSQAPSAKLPFSFKAKVDRIFPVQEYANGSDRSVRLHLSDGEWEATLVLWNEQAALAEGEIAAGDTVECRGAYFRGGEIWVGRNGSITKVAGSRPSKVSELAEGICNVEGEVREAEPDYEYIDKKSGEARKLSSFQLCSGGQCRRVVVWPSNGRNGAPRVHEGDLLLLEGVSFRNGELHFNTYSRMVKRKAAREKGGKLLRASVEGAEAIFKIGENEFRLPLESALRLLGLLSVPDGVSPETVFAIKAQDCCGKDVKYRLDDGGSLAWLSFK